jgi:hypothetical protein
MNPLPSAPGYPQSALRCDVAEAEQSVNAASPAIPQSSRHRNLRQMRMLGSCGGPFLWESRAAGLRGGRR